MTNNPIQCFRWVLGEAAELEELENVINCRLHELLGQGEILNEFHERAARASEDGLLKSLTTQSTCGTGERGNGVRAEGCMGRLICAQLSDFLVFSDVFNQGNLES